MSELPIFEHFLSVGNLKPKLEWFFKPKFFYLNWPQNNVAADEASAAADGSTSNARKRGSVGSDEAAASGRPKRSVVQ